MLRATRVSSSKKHLPNIFNSMADNIASIRRSYRASGDHFDLNNLHSKNPFRQFEKWFDEARVVKSILEPNAMAIATATSKGLPSVRMVLMKDYSEEIGFRFFTNYESRKAKELDENPACSLMFYWEALSRSIRIEGSVKKSPAADNRAYFQSRPRDSQIGALASRQSQVIPNRAWLDDRHAEICKQIGKDEPIEIPEYWGGYDIIPNTFEFWQGQTNRLHDRIVFRRAAENEAINPETTIEGENGWLLERLSS